MDFLKKLNNQGKIELTEPNKDLKEAYIDKSESSLASAKILLEHGKLEESVSLVYYSMYHGVVALLYRIGVKCENHAAAGILLKKLFGIDTSPIKEAKKERIDKQYYTDFSITEEEVREDVEKAEEFNARILDLIARMSQDKIKKAREELKTIMTDF